MKFWGIVSFIILFVFSSLMILKQQEVQTIKVGLLYSKTGTMANEEQSIAKMVHLAIDEINQNGGINNQRVEILEYDGKSNSKEFAKGAKELLSSDIKTIFGCWTSASRKAVKPIIEEANGLLIYPVQYEGIETSNNILYLGATPNQQVNPTISYILKNYGSDIYVVGSDYIYPRMTGIYLDEMAQMVGFKIVGSAYKPLGTQDFSDVVEEIKRLKPNAIINTINGGSNIGFFKELKKQNLSSKDIPIFSFSIDANSLKTIQKEAGDEIIDGHFITASYFEDIDNIYNTKLKQKVKEQLGSDFIITDASYLSYIGVQLWSKALKNTNTLNSESILNNIRKDSHDSSVGILKVSRDNHLSKNMHIGQIKKNSMGIVWYSRYPVVASPFPIFQEKYFWIEKENQLYKGWDNSWEANPILDEKLNNQKVRK